MASIVEVIPQLHGGFDEVEAVSHSKVGDRCKADIPVYNENTPRWYHSRHTLSKLGLRYNLPYYVHHAQPGKKGVVSEIEPMPVGGCDEHGCQRAKL